MVEILAAYACDKCRVRKVACSRERLGCRRCKDEGTACSYSRSGVIRRRRKQKSSGQTHDTKPSETEHSNLQVQPTAKFDSAHERLQRLAGKDHSSFRAVSLLFEAYAAAWQDSAAFNRLADGAEGTFFPLRNHSDAWVKAFVSTLHNGKLLLNSAPPETLAHLAASRPDQVQDRAWVVMFYTIALRVASSDKLLDELTKVKLRSNLWLAFNDVRLLLEPSVLNTQALVILACHTEEYMTPSICGMLVSKACMMLEALGLTWRRLDLATREQRKLFFWHLNVLDKAMALVLRRAPTFHRSMVAGIALPTLDQLLCIQSERLSTGSPSLFGAHHMHQMHLLTRVMADVWHCTYGQDSDFHVTRTVIGELESWHRQAKKILEAAALAEKPFLTPCSVNSVDHGLRALHFHYYYLMILLARSCKQLQARGTQPSQQMLRLLDDMVSDPTEPYNVLIWQLLHYPFVAFLGLFGEIVSKGRAAFEQNEESLEAMEHLPTFLAKMSSRHLLAAKLESIAVKFVEHARSLLYSQENEADELTSNSRLSTQETVNLRQSGSGAPARHLDKLTAPLDPMASANIPNDAGGETFDVQLEEWFARIDNGLTENLFDWFPWTSQA